MIFSVPFQHCCSNAVDSVYMSSEGSLIVRANSIIHGLLIAIRVSLKRHSQGHQDLYDLPKVLLCLGKLILQGTELVLAWCHLTLHMTQLLLM